LLTTLLPALAAMLTSAMLTSVFLHQLLWLQA
jgi:hypothetical protein